MSQINPSEIFGTSDPKELAIKQEAFNQALNKAFEAGERAVNPSASAFAELEAAANNPVIAKALGADALASLQQQINSSRELVKDIQVGDGFTTGTPITTGLVPFDLEAPAKYLAPRPTPLRNKLPREKGQGTSRRFKRITGITGSGTGGTSVIHPGLAETTQNNFAPNGAANALYLNRGSKIAYAGDDKVVPYNQFGLSDSVSFAAQYAGQGFQDIRALSAQSLLYSSMLMEERMLLFGRGANSSYFSGALAAPGTITLTARTATSTETALGLTDKLTVYVTTDAGDFGQSVLSSAVTSATALTSGQVVDVTIPAVAGALGYRVYVGHGASAVASSACYYQGRTSNNTFTISGTLLTSLAASTVTGDTSAATYGYDGIMAYVTGADSGYKKVLNSTFNAVSPGAEFQTAFASMYNSVKADPDEILFNGSDRKQLSELLKNSSSTNYRLQIQQDEIGNAVIGSVITAIQNEVTGKVVPMTVHPWMPQGNTAILSYTLPIPDSQVSNCWSVVNVQDFSMYQWPVVDFQYQASSYWYGTFVSYATAWSGSITGITAA